MDSGEIKYNSLSLSGNAFHLVGGYQGDIQLGTYTLSSTNESKSLLVSCELQEEIFGEVNWVEQFGTGDKTFISDITFDSEGNIYVSEISAVEDSLNSSEIILYKTDSNGSEILQSSLFGTGRIKNVKLEWHAISENRDWFRFRKEFL